jgi:hypothetical protein
MRRSGCRLGVASSIVGQQGSIFCWKLGTGGQAQLSLALCTAAGWLGPCNPLRYSSVKNPPGQHDDEFEEDGLLGQGAAEADDMLDEEEWV